MFIIFPNSPASAFKNTGTILLIRWWTMRCWWGYQSPWMVGSHNNSHRFAQIHHIWPTHSSIFTPYTWAVPIYTLRTVSHHWHHSSNYPLFIWYFHISTPECIYLVYLRIFTSFHIDTISHTLWLSNMATEIPLFMEVLMGTSLTNAPFSIFVHCHVWLPEGSSYKSYIISHIHSSYNYIIYHIPYYILYYFTYISVGI